MIDVSKPSLSKDSSRCGGHHDSHPICAIPTNVNGYSISFIESEGYTRVQLEETIRGYSTSQ